MSDPIRRNAVTWGFAPCVAVMMIVAGARSVVAADVPSLEEIKAHWRQQRDRLQSLYVETVEETTSPLPPKDLQQLPGYARCRDLEEIKVDFAFKGEKRYLRTQMPGVASEPPPIPPLRPNATPLEKAFHESWLENEKEREKRGAFRSRPELREIRRDDMLGHNGRTFWNRYIHEVAHPDGRVEKKPPFVVMWHPTRVSRKISPPTYLRHIALAIAGPDIDAEDSKFQDNCRRHLLPDLLDRWTYSRSDELEQVDGASCVILHRTSENTVTFRDVTEKFTKRDTLWLDLDRGLALRKREQIITPLPRTLCRVTNSEFEEVVPGVWLPKQSVLHEIAPAGDEDFPEEYHGKPILSTRVRVTKLVVNQVPDEVFEPYIKPGEEVVDNREKYSPPLSRPRESGDGVD